MIELPRVFLYSNTIYHVSQGTVHKMMYGFYCFVAAVLVVNFAITILNVYMAEVKRLTKGAGTRHDGRGDLGQFVWRKLLTVCSLCRGDVTRRHPLGETTACGSGQCKYIYICF